MVSSPNVDNNNITNPDTNIPRVDDTQLLENVKTVGRKLGGLVGGVRGVVRGPVIARLNGTVVNGRVKYHGTHFVQNDMDIIKTIDAASRRLNPASELPALKPIDRSLRAVFNRNIRIRDRMKTQNSDISDISPLLKKSSLGGDSVDFIKSIFENTFRNTYTVERVSLHTDTVTTLVLNREINNAILRGI
jgi:hypothetical protein